MPNLELKIKKLLQSKPSIPAPFDSFKSLFQFPKYHLQRKMSRFFSSELVGVLKTLEAIRLRILLAESNDGIEEIEANIRSLKMLLALK